MGTLSVILLHEGMVDKQGAHVTTSLTLIDVHDIARSSRTFGLASAYIAHPSPSLRKMSQTLKQHWEEGFGATYNPNRKDALSGIKIVGTLDEAITDIDMKDGKLPTLVATSAKAGSDRTSFKEFRSTLSASKNHFLLMLGTGWGMSEELLKRAEVFLAPINGPTDYNHLSVRSACAIMLDRICGDNNL